jgi:acetyl-CoA acyltransferase
MPSAVLLDAARTPLGARGGALASWHPADLVAHVLRRLAERNDLDPARVDEVVIGCAMPVGSQGFNIARNAVLGAGWSERVPAGTVDRQGVSSFAAVAAAVRAVASGACDVVIAGGVESMSSTPAGATLVPGAQPFGPSMADRYRERGGLVPLGVAAEGLGLPRDLLDEWALRSHVRASGAAPDRAIVSLGSLGGDELPRADVTAADLAGARPSFVPDGAVTARNSAAMADGAAVALVVSEAFAAASGRAPLARIAAAVEVGVDPLAALTAAAPAAVAVLRADGFDAGDLARIELAEPFAAVPLLFMKELAIDDDRLNPAGGGIARGEPTGAVGACLLATLAHGLDPGDRGLAAGLATGGLGAAVLLERL